MKSVIDFLIDDYEREFDDYKEWGMNYDDVEYARKNLRDYVDALQARAEKAEAVEVEALQLHKNQEAQISEMRRVGNLMADHLNALGISRHDREWADASYPIPYESDPLKGVPYVSLSNAEIAAMTPEHPLYKLVHGDRKCKDE